MFDFENFFETLDDYGKNMDEHVQIMDSMFDQIFDPENGLVQKEGDEFSYTREDD